MADPTNPSDAKAQDAKSQKEMFGRVLHPPRRLFGPALILSVLAIGAIAVLVATRKDPDAVQVVTPVGFRTIRKQMPQELVVQMLGKPLATTPEGCLQFGYPKIDESTTITVVCFENGKVREIRTHLIGIDRVEVPPH